MSCAVALTISEPAMKVLLFASYPIDSASEFFSDALLSDKSSRTRSHQTDHTELKSNKVPSCQR